MGIFLDITLAIILVLSVFFGYKKGLIKVAFNLCAFVLSIIITIFFYTPITNWVIENTEFDENIKQMIIEKNGGKDHNTENHHIQKFVSEYINETKENALNDMAVIISEKAVAIAVAIILFIAIRLILIILSFLISGISNLPIIKQFNTLGGVIYGALVGVFIIYLILAIMFFVVFVNNNGIIAKTIETSTISKMLYNHNILLNIIF